MAPLPTVLTPQEPWHMTKAVSSALPSLDPKVQCLLLMKSSRGPRALQAKRQPARRPLQSPSQLCFAHHHAEKTHTAGAARLCLEQSWQRVGLGDSGRSHRRCGPCLAASSAATCLWRHHRQRLSCCHHQLGHHHWCSGGALSMAEAEQLAESSCQGGGSQGAPPHCSAGAAAQKGQALWRQQRKF